jgi:glucose/mannose-6-phosphate isomerase
MTIDLDDLQAIRDVDAGDMLGAIASLGAHCREAYAAGRGAAELPDLSDVDGVVVCGMGGSAVAGDVLRSSFRSRLGVPVEVSRSPELPEHAGVHTLVVASSYSGNTSETLTAFRAATRRGCRALAVTSGGVLEAEAREHGVPVVGVPGGFQPRAALGWLAFVMLGALQAAGLLPELEDDVAESAELADARAAACRADVPTADNPAKGMALELDDRVPVVWGAEGIAAVAAMRWKTQLNENGKSAAVWEELPEATHNAVVGYPNPEATRDHLEIVFLASSLDHPRNRVRAEVSGELLDEVHVVHRTIEFERGGRFAQALRAIVLGDFVSVYLAAIYGVDPTPVVAIDRVKGHLASSGDEDSG